MEIQTLSIDLSQTEVEEQAVEKAQAMRLEQAKEQAAALENSPENAISVTDPNLGQNVDILD